MRWTVVTGACGTLGKAFCMNYAKHGCSLWITGRSEEKLLQLKNELEESGAKQVKISVCDLSDSIQTKELCIKLKNASVERLVNNAGFGAYGLFETSELSDLIEMNHVNMTALMMLQHAVLKQMKQDGGEIVNVASTAAFQPGPLMSVYYASKAYVLSLSKALYAETKGTKVKVCALCCGPMETGFEDRAGFQHTWMQKLCMISVDKAVLEAEKGLRNGKYCVIPGFFNRIVVLLSGLLPESMLLSLMMKIQDKRKTQC